MRECSLCGNPLPEEGGAVLFTDSRGVPFEVCGECESHFETLRSASNDAGAEQAIDYIFENAGNMDRRSDVYDAIAEYVEACRPPAMTEEPGADITGAKPEEPAAETADAGSGKRGFIKSGILVAVIVALLLLALFLGGFRF